MIHDRSVRRRPFPVEPRVSTRTNARVPDAASGFTLIEMMVVVAIIGILVAVLLPAFSAVRTNAKIADVTAQFNGFSAGLEMFRNETALGGAYPPSRSDSPDGNVIANPFDVGPGNNAYTSGAHLLVHAMLGADLLGPPGFKDFSQPRNGTWSDDTHRQYDPAGASGAYAVVTSGDNEGDLVHPRFGPGFVDEKMRARVKSLQQLQNEGAVAPHAQALPKPVPNGADVEATYQQPVFTDAWGRPILYYRANRAGRLIAGAEDGTPGVYNPKDNLLHTGFEGEFIGVDFGKGGEPRHNLSKAVPKALAYPGALPNGADLSDPNYDGTFAKFVWDRSVTNLNVPVRKDSYLLISAGSDGRYGTGDDVVNWDKDTP